MPLHSQAFWAYGSQFKISDGEEIPSFIGVAEITKLTPLKMKRDSIMVGSHQSPDGYEEKIPGMRDAGAIDIEANWLPFDPTQDHLTGILSTFEDNVNHDAQIVLPDDILTIGVFGHVTEFDGDLPLKEQGKLHFVFELSGKPTFSVPGSS